jgi:hypothetical protein
VEKEQVKINSCIPKYPLQNAKSCRQNFATMETPQAPQRKSEPKRLEYRSPSLAKLGKLADLTLSVGMAGATADGGKGNDKTS